MTNYTMELYRSYITDSGNEVLVYADVSKRNNRLYSQTVLCVL